MTQLDAAGNLLYGVLARRHGFVDHQQFHSAVAAWASDPASSLRDLLRKAGSLPQTEEQRLEAIFLEHVQLCGNDTQKGLGAALSTDVAALETLGDLASLKSNGQQKSAGAAKQPARPVAERRGVELAIRQTFRLGDEVGKGGMGVVFEAFNDELNRRVAVKRIRRRLDITGLEERFLREAQITASLEHPAILPIFSLGHDEDGQPCYAMRFARKGTELKDGDLLRALEDFHHDAVVEGVLDYRGPRFRRLLWHLVAVCHAVELAHSRQIIHRDIKPEHVWLGEFNQTLLLDWGLAKQLGQPEHEDLPLQAAAAELAATVAPGDGETKFGVPVGTPGYMSPEQAAGDQHRLGPASDIYGLGAVLYQLLTCRRSQSDNWQERTIQGIFTPPRQLQPKVPGALEAICLKAMALRPEDRYATAADFRQDLENWLADEPVSVWPDPFVVRTQRWMRRHRTLATSTAAAVLVALVGLSALNVQRTEALNEKTQALRRESDALEQRTNALAAEKIAKEQADTNFGLARTAVDDLFTDVSATQLMSHPGLQSLREDLLRRAKDYYLKFSGSSAKSVGGNRGVRSGHDWIF